MIFQKGSMWKISGHPQKYATYEEALLVSEKLGIKAEKAAAVEAAAEESRKAAADAAEEERLKKLADLASDSTPYEKMIAKNICTTCDMEPCECFTYTKKTELGY